MLHARSVALFAMYYNLARLRTTPAAAAKITKPVWKIGDIVDVLEARRGRGKQHERRAQDRKH
jgi:hypothetical protein